MKRRRFLLMPLALGPLWGCAQPGLPVTTNENRTAVRVPLEFSQLGIGPNKIWRNLRQLVPGDLTLRADLWLRVDGPPAPGGVAVTLNLRVTEDYVSGPRSLLESDNLRAQSAANSNEVHVTGTVSGFYHDDLFRPLALEFGIARVDFPGAAARSGVTVSTVPGKDSFIVVSSGTNPYEPDQFKR